MMDLSECLTNKTCIYVTREVKPKKTKVGLDENDPIIIKKFNHAEFIGEELCSVRNIRCSHYFVVGLGLYELNRFENYGEIHKRGFNYKIGTYNFKVPGCTYKTIKDYDMSLGDSPVDAMLQQTPTEDNKRLLCKELLELLALDIYMGQVDRFSSNYLFEEDKNHNIRLAPLFDFEYSLKKSFLDKNFIYQSDLYTFRTIEDTKEFIKKYPMFRDILASYLDVDLIGAIDRAYSRRGLHIPDDKWKFYREFEENRDKVIQKIIK